MVMPLWPISSCTVRISTPAMTNRDERSIVQGNVTLLAILGAGNRQHTARQVNMLPGKRVHIAKPHSRVQRKIQLRRGAKILR